jgi:hypothetical protein
MSMPPALRANNRCTMLPNCQGGCSSDSGAWQEHRPAQSSTKAGNSESAVHRHCGWVPQLCWTVAPHREATHMHTCTWHPASFFGQAVVVVTDNDIAGGAHTGGAYVRQGCQSVSQSEADTGVDMLRRLVNALQEAGRAPLKLLLPRPLRPDSVPAGVPVRGLHQWQVAG